MGEYAEDRVRLFMKMHSQRKRGNECYLDWSRELVESPSFGDMQNLTAEVYWVWLRWS